MSDSTARPVLTERVGRIGRITLNRPRTLNALDLGMIHSIALALNTWRDDPAVHAVVIDAAGDRAFCAGGDVRFVRDAVLAGRPDDVDAFFVEEYALNRMIADYPKPYVALIDGICMGGGIGLAIHGSIRVATDHASFAMPETQLGLFPDVGGSYFLPRLRGQFGTYMGLTGARIGGPEACWLGLATHYVPRTSLAELSQGLADHGTAALVDFATELPPLELPTLADQIDQVFSLESIAAIVTALRSLSDPWAQTALTALSTASPSALHWTFDLLRAGAHRTFAECQRAETLLTRRACAHPDFAEGVRANVVDKDRKPNWQPLA